MALSVPAVLVISCFTLGVAAGLLLLAWLQHRSATALALWGAAFAMAGAATALIAARGTIDNIWSIVIANVILACAYGVMWSGARKFEGRNPSAVAGLTGSVVWLFACTRPEFYGSPTARATLMAGIGIAYTLLTAGELRRARSDALQ
jgi:hypothetical protein